MTRCLPVRGSQRCVTPGPVTDLSPPRTCVSNTPPDETRGADGDPYVVWFDEDHGVYLLNMAPYAEEMQSIVAQERCQAEARAAAAARTRSRAAARAERRQQLRRRGRVSAVAGAVAVVVSGAVALTALPATAEALPTRVLQAVDIQLGHDGSLTGIDATQVRRTTKGTSSTKTALDPSKVSSGLPVRVLTSWVHDGRSGTDLGALKGVSGTVQVSFTVENTTVHPELLTYDVAGVKQSRYALIGTPLTVTASAVLPKDSLSTLVLPEHNNDRVATNGVPGQTDDGDTTVQWAAVLAPPRLAASTTFTLVTDAKKFALPHFDLSVQPGLSGDTSVDRMLDEAFSKDGSSQLTLESKTIVLISTVNGVLTTASRELEGIRSTLSEGADRLGSKVIGQLADSSSQLASAAGELSGGLTDLDAGLSNALQSNRDKSVAALEQTVANLSDYIGHPDDSPLTALPVTPGCQVALGTAAKSTTLYGQLRTVSQQLLTIAGSTSGCTDALKASLLASLGDPASCATPSHTVACDLVTAQTSLQQVSSLLATSGSALVARFDPNAVDGVRAALTTLTTRVAAVQDAAGKLSASGNDLDKLRAALSSLSSDVTTLAGGLKPGGTGLASALRALSTTAVSRHDQLVSGTSSLDAEVRAAADAACALPEGLAPVAPGVPDNNNPNNTPAPSVGPTLDRDGYLANVRGLLTGTGCAVPGATPSTLPVPSSYGKPVTDRLADQAQAWSDVAAQTDLGAATPTGAAAEVAALGRQLDQLATGLTAAQALAGSPSGGVKGKVAAVQQLVSDLYTQPAGPSACPVTAGSALPPLNALTVAFALVDCNQRGLAGDLRALLVQATPTYDAAAATVGAAATATNTARLAAAASLDDLLGTLTTSLTGAASTSLADGRSVVDAQQTALDQRRVSTTATLDEATRRGIATIHDSIQTSNRQLSASTDLLKAGLAAVQLDLGDPSSKSSAGGLLGLVNSSVSQTGASVGKVGDASSQADAFAGVRGSELDDVLLQQAQLTRALELEAVRPPFALSLPKGSSSTDVFTFHLKPV